MKKLIEMRKKLFGVIISLAVLVFAVNAFAVGTVTQSFANHGQNQFTITFTCTADSAAHTFPSTATTQNIDGWVYMVTTDPGATAPTADYDITLSDAQSVDVMGGTVTNRSATVSEQAIPALGDSFGPRPVWGPLTLAISNNSVNSAIVTVTVYFYR